jgi:hypothetical protein
LTLSEQNGIVKGVYTVGSPAVKHFAACIYFLGHISAKKKLQKKVSKRFI